MAISRIIGFSILTGRLHHDGIVKSPGWPGIDDFAARCGRNGRADFRRVVDSDVIVSAARTKSPLIRNVKEITGIIYSAAGSRRQFRAVSGHGVSPWV